MKLLILILTAWTALSFIAGPFLAPLIGRAEAWHRDGERGGEFLSHSEAN